MFVILKVVKVKNVYTLESSEIIAKFFIKADNATGYVSQDRNFTF